MKWLVKRAPRTVGAGLVGAVLSATLTVGVFALPGSAASAAARHAHAHAAHAHAGPASGPGQAPTCAAGAGSCGSIRVRVQNHRGSVVAGARVTLSMTQHPGSPPLVTCTIGPGTGGRCVFTGLALGHYVVAQTYSPAGSAPARRVTVSCGCVSHVVMTDARRAAYGDTGSVVVRTTAGGAPLPGATFSLFTSAGPGRRNPTGQSCTTVLHTHGGATCRLGPVASGRYLVAETGAPHGYQLVPGRSEVVIGNRTVPFHLLKATRTGAVTVHARSTHGTELTGATYALYAVHDHVRKHRPAGHCTTSRHGSQATCTVHRLRPGTYALVETGAPAGFSPVGDKRVTVRAGLLTKATRLEPMMPGTGVVHIHTDVTDVGVTHAPAVLYATFALYADGGGIIGAPTLRSCVTTAQGRRAGCEIAGVAPGSYYVAETTPPPPGQSLMAPKRITVVCNRISRVTFVGTPTAPGTGTGTSGGGGAGGAGAPPPATGLPTGPSGALPPGWSGATSSGTPASTTGSAPVATAGTPTVAPAVATPLTIVPPALAAAGSPPAKVRDAAARVVATTPTGESTLLWWLAALLVLAMLMLLAVIQRRRHSPGPATVPVSTDLL